MLVRGLVAAGVGLLLAPATASATVYADFTVDPTLTPLTTGDQFVADQINGRYQEDLKVLTFDPGTGLGTFTTDAYWFAQGFSKNDGASPVTPGVAGGYGTNYSLYAVFSSDGNFKIDADGKQHFNGTSGTVSVYYDDNADTDWALPADPAAAGAAGQVSLTNSSDDKLLAYSTSLVRANGNANPSDPNDANGDFALVYNPFNLTGVDPFGLVGGAAVGADFFVQPVPFYIQVILQGVFDNFNPTAAGTVFTTGGVADAAFEPVPEPATLTLLGLGLLGSSAAARRRRKAQTN